MASDEEEMETFDTVSAPVGTVFYDAFFDGFVRKGAEDRWTIYDSGGWRTDAEMAKHLTEDDEEYVATATTGQTPVLP